LGVIATMVYFIVNLIKDHFGIPYEFILLVAVAIVSLINVFGTTVAKCCGALSPGFALALDFISLAGYAVAFGLLTHGMGATVFGSCMAGAWGAEGGDGVWICKLYKAAWAFALGGVVFFLSSVALDVHALRKNANHKYVPANPKSMQQTKTYAQPDYSQNTSYGSGGLNGP